MKRSRPLRVGLLGLGLVLAAAASAAAGEYGLTVDHVTVDTGGFTRPGIGYNGASPGPLLRFQGGRR